MSLHAIPARFAAAFVAAACLFLSPGANAQKSTGQTSAQTIPQPQDAFDSRAANAKQIADANATLRVDPDVITAFISRFVEKGGYVKKFAEVGAGIAKKFTSFALMLLAAMVTIMLFREFAASMAEGRGPPGLDLVITTITPMIIVGGIIGLYDRFVVKTLLDILGWLLGVIGDAGGTLAAEMFTVTIGAIIGAMIANFQGLTMGSWWEGLKAMAPALVNVGILTLALLMVVWAICEFVCVIAKGGILLAIGLAFGPIMMVFATTSMFRDFFSKWMGFVLGAIMTMVIGFMLASIMVVFLDPLVKLYANGSAGFTDTLLVLIMTYVMKEVISAAPTIASGLVPGHLGIGAGNTSRAIALQGSAAAAMLPLKATSFASKGAQMGLRGVEKGLGTASTKASDAAGKFRKGVDGAIGKAADWRQSAENAANWKPNRPPPKPPDKPGP